MLALPPDAHGAVVYCGDVTAEGDSAVSYRYERRRRRGAEGATTTHITHSAASGDVVVLQQAHTASDGTLLSYTEVHAQTATAARVDVDPATNTVRYVVTHDGADAVTTEPIVAPLVTGPTLFAFAVAHRSRLARGEAIDLQFVVASAGQSYRFALTGGETGRGFRAVMRASDLLVALLVAPAEVEFVDDDAGLHVAQYRGRIPPLCAGRPCDGEVSYRAAMPFE